MHKTILRLVMVPIAGLARLGGPVAIHTGAAWAGLPAATNAAPPPDDERRDHPWD